MHLANVFSVLLMKVLLDCWRVVAKIRFPISIIVINNGSEI